MTFLHTFCTIQDKFGLEPCSATFLDDMGNLEKLTELSFPLALEILAGGRSLHVILTKTTCDFIHETKCEAVTCSLIGDTDSHQENEVFTSCFFGKGKGKVGTGFWGKGTGKGKAMWKGKVKCARMFGDFESGSPWEGQYSGWWNSGGRGGHGWDWYWSQTNSYDDCQGSWPSVDNSHIEWKMAVVRQMCAVSSEAFLCDAFLRDTLISHGGDVQPTVDAVLNRFVTA